MFDNGQQNVVFYPKLASSSDPLTQVHHQGESCRSCWMQIKMVNAEKYWWSMQRNVDDQCREMLMINAEKYWWIMRVNIDDQCKIILMINVEKYWISMQMNIDGQYREIKDEFERNALNMPWAWVKICTKLRYSLASVPKQALYKIGKSSLPIWNGVSSPLFLHCASQAPLATCKCRFHQVGLGSTSTALPIQEFSWSKKHFHF